MNREAGNIGLEGGVATLHARAEAWECDFNGHWNTRYYCRSFQIAGQVACAFRGARDAGGAADVPVRLLRFHKELHGGDPITIRTFNLTGFEGGEAATHYMFSNGKVVATALEYGQGCNDALTSLDAAEAVLALPRGLSSPVTKVWEPDPAIDQIYELGPVKAEELQDNGQIQFWMAVARMSNASHHHDLGLGFTLELMKESGVGRMLAELRHARLGHCNEGDFLRCASRMTSASGKVFTTAHFLYTHSGTPVAMFDLCTLATDMKARRVIELPGFVMERMAQLR